MPTRIVMLVLHFPCKNKGLKKTNYFWLCKHTRTLPLTPTWTPHWYLNKSPHQNRNTSHSYFSVTTTTNAHIADISLSHRVPRPILPTTLDHFASLNSILNPTTTLYSHCHCLSSYLYFLPGLPNGQTSLFCFHSYLFLNSFSIMTPECFYWK